ncbi:hypothetical protein GNI_028200, partial [Gregarina niphandrodes]
MSVEQIRMRMAKLSAAGTASSAGRGQMSGVSSPQSTAGGSTKEVDKPMRRQSSSAAVAPAGAAKQASGELAGLTDEILVFCHLLDSSRRRALDDCVNLRQTIRELEKLLESSRQREVSHLSYVEQQREAIGMFEKRYYSLKSRARGLMKEAQETQEKLKVELDDLRAKYKNAETSLYSTQTLLDDQARELEQLRAQTKNSLSEKEIQNMRLKLLKLEDENGRLATERQALVAQLEGKGSVQPKSKKDEDMTEKLRQENESLRERLEEVTRQKDEFQD